jgi:hypothetical protein
MPRINGLNYKLSKPQPIIDLSAVTPFIANGVFDISCIGSPLDITKRILYLLSDYFTEHGIQTIIMSFITKYTGSNIVCKLCFGLIQNIDIPSSIWCSCEFKTITVDEYKQSAEKFMNYPECSTFWCQNVGCFNGSCIKHIKCKCAQSEYHFVSFDGNADITCDSKYCRKDNIYD